MKNLNNLLIVLLLSLICATFIESVLSQTLLGGEGAASRRVVMIIAKNEFRDEELMEPKVILEEGGFEVVLASSSLGAATGMLGATADVDVTINEINPSDYDAVIFVGGRGASEYWQNPTAHSIAKKADKQGKLVCAICIAPVTLANAGLLSGRKATVWYSEANTLKKAGAIYTAEAVTVDGNIITANGPTSAKEFGRTILEKVKTKK